MGNPAVMAHHSNGQNNGEDTDDDEVMEVDQEGQSIKESIKAPTQDNPPPSPLPQVIVTNDQQQPPKEASLDNQAVTATPVVTIHSEETNPNVTTQKETTHAAGSVQDETRAGIFDSIQKYQKLEEKRKKEDKEAATETIDEIIDKTDAEARAASAPVSRAVSTGLEIDQVTETKEDHETKPFRGLFARAARQSDQVTETVHETKQVGLFDSTEPFPRPYRDRTGQFRHKTGAEAALKSDHETKQVGLFDSTAIHSEPPTASTYKQPKVATHQPTIETFQQKINGVSTSYVPAPVGYPIGIGPPVGPPVVPPVGHYPSKRYFQAAVCKTASAVNGQEAVNTGAMTAATSSHNVTRQLMNCPAKVEFYGVGGFRADVGKMVFGPSGFSAFSAQDPQSVVYSLPRKGLDQQGAGEAGCQCGHQLEVTCGTKKVNTK